MRFIAKVEVKDPGTEHEMWCLVGVQQRDEKGRIVAELVGAALVDESDLAKHIQSWMSALADRMPQLPF